MQQDSAERQRHTTTDEEQRMPEGHGMMKQSNSQDAQPIDHRTREAISIEAEIEEMRRLAVEIAAAWVSPKTGVELIAEQRR